MKYCTKVLKIKKGKASNFPRTVIVRFSKKDFTKPTIVPKIGTKKIFALHFLGKNENVVRILVGRLVARSNYALNNFGDFV